MLQIYNISKTNRCTACGACVNVCPKSCIEWAEDNEGFLQLNIREEDCINCGLCDKTCPVINEPRYFSENNCFAAWSNDDYIRSTSSSGGMFLSLANEIIKEDGVVYGVILDSEGNVHHQKVSNYDALKAMQGSKYVQSNVGNSYHEIKETLKTGQKVMFTGTPCQVAGLRKVVGYHENLLAVDILCHGVPANKLFKDYINKLRREIGAFDVSSFDFRNRKGWGCQSSITLSDGNRVVLSKEKDVYLKLFLKDTLLRESCYQCPFAKTERCSDITIADFWRIGAKESFDYDTSKGCSLVIVHSDAGKNALNKCNNLFIQARNLQEAIEGNPNLWRPTIRPKSRDSIYDYFYNHSLKAVDRKYLSGLWFRCKRFAGKVKRKLS